MPKTYRLSFATKQFLMLCDCTELHSSQLHRSCPTQCDPFRFRIELLNTFIPAVILNYQQKSYLDTCTSSQISIDSKALGNLKVF